jgi:hypothetical protein
MKSTAGIVAGVRPSANLTKLFSPSITFRLNKLECFNGSDKIDCLSLGRLYNLDPML